MKYYYTHFIISTVMSLFAYYLTDHSLIALFFGFFMYVFREEGQYRKTKYWDHKGYLFPLLSSFILIILIRYI